MWGWDLVIKVRTWSSRLGLRPKDWDLSQGPSPSLGAQIPVKGSNPNHKPHNVKKDVLAQLEDI